MKKLEWLLKGSDGVVLGEFRTRDGARDSKNFYRENIFEHWLDDVKHPLKIVRQEWELKGEKVVR